MRSIQPKTETETESESESNLTECTAWQQWSCFWKSASLEPSSLFCKLLVFCVKLPGIDSIETIAQNCFFVLILRKFWEFSLNFADSGLGQFHKRSLALLKLRKLLLRNSVLESITLNGLHEMPSARVCKYIIMFTVVAFSLAIACQLLSETIYKI